MMLTARKTRRRKLAQIRYQVACRKGSHPVFQSGHTSSGEELW